MAVATSCSGSDGKKAVPADGAGGAGGEHETSSGGTRSGGDSGGKPPGGSAGAMSSGGAAGAMSDAGEAGRGGAAGERASGQGGAAGEDAASGRSGGGEAGSPSSCCDPEASYSASEGLLPSDDACSLWTLTDTAEPEVATVGAGALRVGTSADAEHMYFIHSNANLGFPDVFVFEARMKLVSGTGSTPSRAPASMAFVYGAGRMKNMLQMSATEVFILQSENVKGQSIAFDTTSDFHTYRIVADTQAHTLQVFIDGELELSGNAFADPSSNPFVLFGESSIYAYGVSEWQFAKHNAYRCEIAPTL